MQDANKKEQLRTHLRRIALGAGLGLAAAVLCPQLPEKWQALCRFTLAIANALGNK